MAAARPTWLLALAVAAWGCAHAAPAVVATAPPTPGAVHWVRSSVEYHALCLQAYGLATRRLESAAHGRAPRSWGVVLDADETVLDNSAYQKERALDGLGYSEQSWSAWVRRREARAVPGARGFLAATRALGGAIAIVTNRAAALCDATRENLAALELAFDVVVCKPEGGPSEKDARFAAVASGTADPRLPPLEVLAYVGDNIRDFPGWTQADRARPEAGFQEFGVRYFLLPNPMYGSWEGNPAE